MNQRSIFGLSSIVVALSLALAACASPAPATVQPVSDRPAATGEAQGPGGAAAAPSGSYSEAPMLAELVKAGKLPPVGQRVSDEPLVVEPVEEIGQYGGTWRRAWKGPANDFQAYGGLNYEPVLRWPRDPKDPVQPGLAKKWEFSPDGKTLTLYFRKGLRWSDGQPWTVDDIIFWWEDIELNKELTTAPHAEWVTS